MFWIIIVFAALLFILPLLSWFGAVLGFALYGFFGGVGGAAGGLLLQLGVGSLLRK